MSAHEQPVAAVHRLAIRQLGGTLNDQERADLIELLKSSPQARRDYLAHMQDSASLRWIFSGHCDRGGAVALDNGRDDRLNRGRPRWLLVAMVLAASVACVVGVNLWQHARQAATRPLDSVAQAAPAKYPRKHVATLSALADVKWAHDSRHPPLLSRVATGQSFEFTHGTLELTFDTGALVKVFGPARFEVSSPSKIVCSRGRATTLVGKSGRGFTIETPKARIVDLGTEFGVNISEHGETEVVVFQGSVDLMRADDKSSSANAADSWTRRLEQGEAMLLNNRGEAQRLVAVERGDFFPLSNADRFGRDTPPLILDVQDNIRDSENTKCYQIVHNGLGEDAPCFVDRGHQWNGVDETGIPDFLLGADYIMPFNSDKFIGDLKVDVKVSRPATCYIFFDDNMSPPAWLRKDFQRASYRIGMDSSPTIWHKDHAVDRGPGRSIDFTFSIWRRDIPKAGVISLGGVDPPEAATRSQGFNMYGIAVVEKPPSAK
jgi:hypothetical protein